MTKVWIITMSEREDGEDKFETSVIGVYASEEKAMKALDAFWKSKKGALDFVGEVSPEKYMRFSVHWGFGDDMYMAAELHTVEE